MEEGTKGVFAHGLKKLKNAKKSPYFGSPNVFLPKHKARRAVSFLNPETFSLCPPPPSVLARTNT